MALAAFLMQTDPPALALRVVVLERMATTAPMRAKAKVITEISARSRSPTTVDVSMLSSSSRACWRSRRPRNPVCASAMRRLFRAYIKASRKSPAASIAGGLFREVSGERHS
jgi:hypothetical protein